MIAGVDQDLARCCKGRRKPDRWDSGFDTFGAGPTNCEGLKTSGQALPASHTDRKIPNSAIYLFRLRAICHDRVMDNEAAYICDSCGEEIVVPVDFAAGSSQEYVEDCPVCCCPGVIHVDIDEDGNVRVWAQAEQDRF